MRTTKIRIKNLFGISEVLLKDKNYEITGSNGTAKTSILDAIKFALTNKSNRDVILRQGSSEGEILVETDTGISISRKERLGKIGISNVKEGKTPITTKEKFLRGLFSELQLNPVEFISMPKQEQNRLILDLIDFKWDLNWIKEQFGEIVPEINYEQNILKVLSDIQADEGYYYRTRQDINREARNKQAFVEEIAKTLPENYSSSKWEKMNLSELYTKIEKIRAKNREIEKANSVIENQENKMRSFDADKEIAMGAVNAEVSGERTRTEKDIIRLENQIETLKKDLNGLEEHKISQKEKIELKYKADVAKFKTLISENEEIAKGKPEDITELLEEAGAVETMKGFIGEYKRMCSYEREVESLNVDSQGLTTKIEKARTLPGEILAVSKLPLKNLTIVDGVPLIDELPINNLSEGEKVILCIKIASIKSKLTTSDMLNLLLIDGMEKLNKQTREIMYKECIKQGVRFLATRTTDDAELIITEI